MQVLSMPCFGVISWCDFRLCLPRVAHASEGCISQKHCAAVLFRVYDWEESEGFRRMACRGSGVRVSLAPLRNPVRETGFEVLALSLQGVRCTHSTLFGAGFGAKFRAWKPSPSLV